MKKCIVNKMKSKQKKHCPLCGKNTYYHDVRPFKLTYKGETLTIQQPCFWCDSCGEGIIDGNDRKSTRETIQVWRSKIDGLLQQVLNSFKGGASSPP